MTPARITRIRTIAAYGLNLAESLNLDPTHCDVEIARDGGWSSLSMWFETPEDMLTFADAVSDRADGRYGEQGEPKHRLASWSRDPYDNPPVLDGEEIMYIRLTSRITETS